MYSRTTCGLCDTARDTILALRDEMAFGYEEVFVDGNQELERRYGLRVPVIEVDGEERFETQVDPSQLREVLAGARTLRD
ncbi:MAG TPA: glutaredoxin family protein [Actinomycetota bacterium]|nr:glutaredoxin family protein [Actinomycetota bacterium]